MVTWRTSQILNSPRICIEMRTQHLLYCVIRAVVLQHCEVNPGVLPYLWDGWDRFVSSSFGTILGATLAQE